MSIKYKLSQTLLAAALAVVPVFGLGCGNKSSGLESRVIQSDKTLSLARKQIDAEEYSSTIKLLEGYSTNDSGVLAERSFLLGEATIKSLNNESFRTICHFVRIRGVPPQLSSEVGPTKTEILKLYREASSYFDSAIKLDSDLENRVAGIYLVQNKKIVKPNKNDARSIFLLKRLYHGLKTNDESAILEAADVNYLRKLRLDKIEKKYNEDLLLRNLAKQREEFVLELKNNPRYTEYIKVCLAKIDKEIEVRKGELEREKADNIGSEKAKIESLSIYDLVKKAEDEYGIYWMDDNDAIIILKADTSSTELLALDLEKKYNYPFLQRINIKVSEKTGKLESFDNDLRDY